MKNFIFRYLLTIAAITITGASTASVAQAQELPSTVPSWLSPYKQGFGLNPGVSYGSAPNSDDSGNGKNNPNTVPKPK
jgi:hypothetical protein